ncbi:MAG: hypothetical protein ABIJ03_03370 [Patescibacteria group bacterium]|nr:hypothetical protein [Patescibacteria group bacterium]
MKHIINKLFIAYKKSRATPPANVFVWLLIIIFLLNQLMIANVTMVMGMKNSTSMTIIAPKLNADGKTTSLFEWSTISQVMASPQSGDALADAKVVMTATGQPFYAPDNISFDDPINAQKKWGVYETSIRLQTEEEARYQKLVTLLMTCSYCCGGPNNVTMVKNCGCAHAKAVRGFYRYMIQNYGDQYSDEQLVGESHRWYALWYPKGMLEDYLLMTGNEGALPHTAHGGSGTEGRHGINI